MLSDYILLHMYAFKCMHMDRNCSNLYIHHYVSWDLSFHVVSSIFNFLLSEKMIFNMTCTFGAIEDKHFSVIFFISIDLKCFLNTSEEIYFLTMFSVYLSFFPYIQRIKWEIGMETTGERIYVVETLWRILWGFYKAVSEIFHDQGQYKEMLILG